LDYRPINDHAWAFIHGKINFSSVENNLVVSQSSEPEFIFKLF